MEETKEFYWNRTKHFCQIRNALDLYKSRDASEKLFREDKTFLGGRTIHCQTNEALHAKIFIEFVALIIRNRMHFLLKEQMLKTHHKENYMTVPAAIHELEFQFQYPFLFYVHLHIFV